MGPAAKPAHVRFVQAGAFLLGALALEALIERGSTPFYWTPLIIAFSYLGAAIAGGRSGGHWPTACVLLGWGTVVVWAALTRPTDVNLEGAYLVGAGAGVLVAGLLLRRGFKIDVVGLGGAAVGAGLVLALASRHDAIGEARTFAIALAVVALVNVALGLAARRR
ncbi:MAG: hypothetical protein M3417_00120 [Actinomycetota bacterium]|nr:hypothetical protein [Actinomycetota bacterium]